MCIRDRDNVCKALPCGELLQHCLLIGYGVALTLLVIIFAKVITAQSFVQSSDCLLYTSLVDGGKKLHALTLIASVVDTNVKPLFRKLGVA